MPAVVLADFVDGHDVRVIQPRRRFGFRVKTLLQRRRGQLPGENHLQCDGPIEAYLPRAIDDAHPTTRDFFEQFVIAEITDAWICDLRFTIGVLSGSRL